jgi:hypothetical protein
MKIQSDANLQVVNHKMLGLPGILRANGRVEIRFSGVLLRVQMLHHVMEN